MQLVVTIFVSVVVGDCAGVVSVLTGVLSSAVVWCCVVWCGVWCGVLNVRKDAGQDERVLVWACWSLTAHSLSTRQTLLVTSLVVVREPGL